MDLQLKQGAIERDGESIYWELVSSGPDDQRPVVVLTHGGGGTHAVWFQQVPTLGARYRIVTWDSRGFGNSTNRGASPSPEAAGADLAAVLDHLDIGPVHLVGQSMGGWHISAFALAHPARVLSLTYADTFGGMWTQKLRDAFASFRTGGGFGSTDAVVLGHHAALWKGTADRDPALAFLYQEMGSLHSPPLGAIGDVMEAFHVSHDQIAALGVPVLFVAGTHEAIFPPAALAECAAGLDGAQFVEIADAGHSPYFEQPGVWNAAVLEFLNSV